MEDFHAITHRHLKDWRGSFNYRNLPSYLGS